MFWQSIKKYYLVRLAVKVFYQALLFLFFCFKIIESGWAIARLILKGSKGDEGMVLTYHTNLEKPWQELILFNMMSMTPGSLAIDVSEDGRSFIIHLLNLHERGQFYKDAAKFEALLKKAI